MIFPSMCLRDFSKRSESPRPRPTEPSHDHDNRCPVLPGEHKICAALVTTS